jgi:hypothetical protein
MFVLTVSNSAYRNHLYDIVTLEDVVIGLTGDEHEARRIANIAGNMKIGDVFYNTDIYLKCKKESNDEN